MIPDTLNDMAESTKVPETCRVFGTPTTTEQVPLKSTNELQANVLMVKLSAKVSQRMEGTKVDTDGSKLTFRTVGSPNTVGVNKNVIVWKLVATVLVRAGEEIPWLYLYRLLAVLVCKV